MLNNYQYFIALAEELNISRAAERLFISHQCLSKYLKNLEQGYRITFFERSPRLCLTPAGEAYLKTLRQVQFLESNLENQLDDFRDSKKGILRFGTTEGRYRVLIPALLSNYQKLYPDVKLVTYYYTSAQLCDRILQNDLDLALMNQRDISPNHYDVSPIIEEHLHLVISDHLLAQFFPAQYPACKEAFQKGINLADFQNVPYVLNFRGFNSREVLEKYAAANNIRLNCVLELSQQDLHIMLAAKDYAACFCWDMYIPTIDQNNQSPSLYHLNVFPINDSVATNQFILVKSRGKLLPAYGRDFMNLIKKICSSYIVQ